jgi:hypothetical protein
MSRLVCCVYTCRHSTFVHESFACGTEFRSRIRMPNNRVNVTNCLNFFGMLPFHQLVYAFLMIALRWMCWISRVAETSTAYRPYSTQTGSEVLTARRLRRCCGIGIVQAFRVSTCRVPSFFSPLRQFLNHYQILPTDTFNSPGKVYIIALLVCLTHKGARALHMGATTGARPLNFLGLCLVPLTFKELTIC